MSVGGERRQSGLLRHDEESSFRKRLRTSSPEEAVCTPGVRFDEVEKIDLKINEDRVTAFPSKRVQQVVEDAFGQRRPSVESVPNLLSLRQHGLLRRPFPSKVFQCKLKGIGKKFDDQKYDDIYERSLTCETLLTEENVSFVAGIWKEPDTGRLQLSFEKLYQPKERKCHAKHDLSSESVKISLYPVVNRLSFGPVKLRDSCIVSNTGNECGLLACFVGLSSAAVMLSCSNSVIPMEECKTIFWRDAVFSCAYSRFAHKVAFGMDGFGLVYQWDHMMMQPTRTNSHGCSLFSVAFDSSGQILFGGSTDGDIFCSDLRSNPFRKYAYKIALQPHALRSLHVLRNDYHLLVGGDNNQLLLVDARMRRPLLSYGEHVSDHAKIPFTVDEELGVLCSVGQDGLTRLWNLNSGRLINTVQAPVSLDAGEIPSAIFKSNWGQTLMLPTVIIGCKDKMYLYHI